MSTQSEKTKKEVAQITAEEGCAVCNRCKRSVSVALFPKSKTNKSGRYSYCKNCCHEQYKAKRQNAIRYTAGRFLADIRQRAKSRNIPCDLDLPFLMEKFQTNRCELSGLEWRSESTITPYSPSIDRIDPSLGYTKDNVRVILMGLNALKGSGTDQDMKTIILAMAKAFGEAC